ncbi:trehalose biosynthesis protein [Brachybacterium sp. DNPG3]
MDAQDAAADAVPSSPAAPRPAVVDLVARARRTDPARLADLGRALAAWMPAQRWFAHKGDRAEDRTDRSDRTDRTDDPVGDRAGACGTEVVGALTLVEERDHAVSWVAVRVATGSGDVLYQVPLVLRPQADGADGPVGPDAADAAGAAGEEPGARITTLAGPDGPVLVLDALRDADGRAATLGLLQRSGPLEGASLELLPARADRPALPVGEGARSRLLSGEQSNSSIVVEQDGVAPVILKVFRVLQDGDNPDVVLQGALSEVGSTRVPSAVGSARVSVGPLRGHALFAQEFLPGVEDAWRTTLRAAAAAEDVSDAVRDLGTAVAEIHRDLAEALGTVPTPASDAAAIVGRMIRRISEVAAIVPEVAAHRTALEVLYGSCLDIAWPDRQRIHGDLHLGQVLSAPGRGWVLLDFEGEPLRPLAERSRPDSPVRDVAGMLRSLDYAAAAVQREHGADPEATARWLRSAREAFLSGYVREAGLDARPVSAPDADALRILLAAFEADKAVYEALYEARNRPDWLGIPLGALERITQRVLDAEARESQEPRGTREARKAREARDPREPEGAQEPQISGR